MDENFRDLQRQVNPRVTGAGIPAAPARAAAPRVTRTQQQPAPSFFQRHKNKILFGAAFGGTAAGGAILSYFI
ncbi:hypothetical protein JXA05_01830 [Candidatus Peregrinibacteria bacterium]|nr:hypothetical protein [Candidatus Peregrinibacteria bacterium]